MTPTLVINEIYLSLQGESTFAGLPCVFIRLTGCHLRCAYCDTAYAFRDGKRTAIPDILATVSRLADGFVTAPETATRLPLVELTGGEPLLQANSLGLLRQLCDQGFTVLLETSGARDLASVDARVRRIMDLKCPSSGEVARNRWANLDSLRATDEIKFVIASQEDYEWAKQAIAERGLDRLCPLLFSPVTPLDRAQRHPSLKPDPPGLHPISRRELAERIIADKLPVRYQIQMHKSIWPPTHQGV